MSAPRHVEDNTRFSARNSRLDGVQIMHPLPAHNERVGVRCSEDVSLRTTPEVPLSLPIPPLPYASTRGCRAPAPGESSHAARPWNASQETSRTGRSNCLHEAAVRFNEILKGHPRLSNKATVLRDPVPIPGRLVSSYIPAARLPAPGERRSCKSVCVDYRDRAFATFDLSVEMGHLCPGPSSLSSSSRRSTIGHVRYQRCRPAGYRHFQPVHMNYSWFESSSTAAAGLRVRQGANRRIVGQGAQPHAFTQKSSFPATKIPKPAKYIGHQQTCILPTPPQLRHCRSFPSFFPGRTGLQFFRCIDGQGAVSTAMETVFRCVRLHQQGGERLWR